MLIIGGFIVFAKVVAGSTGIFLAGKGFVSLFETKQIAQKNEKDKIEVLFEQIRCIHRELFEVDSSREFDPDKEREFWDQYASLVQLFPHSNLEIVEDQQVSTVAQREEFYSSLRTLPINLQNIKQAIDLFVRSALWLDSRREIKEKIREVRSMQSSSIVRNDETFRDTVINTMEAISKFWASSSHKNEYKKCFQGFIGNRNFVSLIGSEIAEAYSLFPMLKKHLPLTFPVLANWVSFYDYCFEVNKFPKFDYEEFKTELNRYVIQFSPPSDFNSAEHYGFVEKKQVETKTKIFVRADLHGDLKTLIENLKILREKGLLDDDYCCKPNVILVFLGDYVDRGDHSLQVLRVLFALKLSNPDQVILLRGNHEDVNINTHEDARAIGYGEGDVDKAFKKFRQNEENKRLLNQFYNTLPLAAYVGQKNENGSCQYSLFTHGMFELHVDPIEMLNSPNPTDRMLISKKVEMSRRMQDVSSRLRDPDVSTTENKLLRACVRINALVTGSSEAREAWRGGTAYNWADVTPYQEERFIDQDTGKPMRRLIIDEDTGLPIYESTMLQSLGDREWRYHPEDIKHYLRLSSDERSRIKIIFKGHQHEISNASWPMLDGRIVISTLSIAMEDPFTHHSFDEQPDKTLILTTEEKVRDWTKRALFRHYGCSKITETDEFSVYESGTYRVVPEGGSRVLSVQI